MMCRRTEPGYEVPALAVPRGCPYRDSAVLRGDLGGVYFTGSRSAVQASHHSRAGQTAGQPSRPSRPPTESVAKHPAENFPGLPQDIGTMTWGGSELMGRLLLIPTDKMRKAPGVDVAHRRVCGLRDA